MEALHLELHFSWDESELVFPQEVVYSEVYCFVALSPECEMLLSRFIGFSLFKIDSKCQQS